MRTTIFLSLGLLACATPSGTATAPGTLPSGGEVVMTVNGNIEVTQPMVDAVTARIPPAQLERMQTSGQMQQLHEQLAVGEILYQRAIDEGVLNEEAAKFGAAMAVRQYLASYMVQRAGEGEVSDEDLQKMYEERSVQYQKAQAHASHILVKELDEANALLAKINAGEDFAALAKEHSTDPGSGKEGGDLGWFEAGRMVKEFSDAAFAANAGDVVGPVETRFGFHIIKVHEKRDMTPLDDVRDQLKETIQRTNQESYLDEVTKSLEISKPGDEKAAAPAEAEGDAAAAAGDEAAAADKE
jgi:peptidyl-prolyl cis-trans isomerase C